jgi:hypothetical protein
MHLPRSESPVYTGLSLSQELTSRIRPRIGRGLVLRRTRRSVRPSRPNGPGQQTFDDIRLPIGGSVAAGAMDRGAGHHGDPELRRLGAPARPHARSVKHGLRASAVRLSGGNSFAVATATTRLSRSSARSKIVRGWPCEVSLPFRAGQRLDHNVGRKRSSDAGDGRAPPQRARAGPLDPKTIFPPRAPFQSHLIDMSVTFKSVR